MFKRIRGVPFLAGAIAALCMTSAFAEIPTNASGRPVAGKSMAEFQSYKASCPECLQVAQDIIKMRTQHCQQAGDVDQTILQDPIYPYLNGIRVMLANRGGTTAPCTHPHARYSKPTLTVKTAATGLNAVRKLSKTPLVAPSNPARSSTR